MPRTATTAQAAALEADFYNGAARVKIADADGTLRDWSAQADTNWIDALEVDGDVDQQVSGATITLRREIGITKSISPFMAASTINRNEANDFAPAIDIGRLIVIEVATVGIDAGVIEDDDYVELFRGYIDRFTWASSACSLTCRDLGSTLVDTFVQTATNYGSVDGISLLTVMGDVLNDWGDGTILHFTADPGFDITQYTQAAGTSVMDALFALAQTIGWGLYTLWDDASASWRLTVIDPDRTKETPDLTITVKRVLSFTDLFIDRANVRNHIDLGYADFTSGRTTITAIDDDSIAEYGDRWFGITEPDGSPINDSTQATRMVSAALADLKDPKAEQEVEMHFDWRIQINDLLKFEADGLRYDSDQIGAVVGFTHKLSAGKWRTTVRTRGKPAGAYNGWFGRAKLTSARGPTLRVQATNNGNGTYTITWAGSLVSLIVDDGTSGTPPESPIIVTQDLKDHLYTFLEAGNGPVTAVGVTVPAIFKTGPELSWDIDASGNISVGIIARRGADSTFLAIRSDRRPIVSEILAGQQLGPGVGTGTIVYTDHVLPGASATIAPHTHVWMGAISQTSNGNTSDPTYLDFLWSGIGLTPLPVVTLTEQSVTSNAATLAVVMDVACRRVDLYLVQSHSGIAFSRDDDGNRLVWPTDISDIATERPFAIIKKQPDGTYQDEITFPCQRPGDLLYVTAIPIDANGEEGVHVNYLGVTSDSAGTAPNPPTLAAASGVTSSSASTVATIPSTGEAASNIRTYLDGQIYETQTAVGGGSTQILTVTGLLPGTWHRIGASCISSDGSESTIATIDPFLTSSGGSLPDAGQLVKPTGLTAVYNEIDQCVSIAFTPGSGNPAITRYRVRRSTSIDPTMVDTGIVAVVSPAVVPQQQLSTPQLFTYELEAFDPTGNYVTSDASDTVDCAIQSGES